MAPSVDPPTTSVRLVPACPAPTMPPGLHLGFRGDVAVRFEQLELQNVDSNEGFTEFLRQPAFEALYAMQFESRIDKTVELESLESMRSHYEQSMRQWNAERKAMQAEIETLRAQKHNSGVSEEIARAKESLRQKELQLEELMSEDAFPYGEILKIKAECQTLEAYVQGLTFQAANPQL
jgi:hypothetical protein